MSHERQESPSRVLGRELAGAESEHRPTRDHEAFRVTVARAKRDLARARTARRVALAAALMALIGAFVARGELAPSSPVDPRPHEPRELAATTAEGPRPRSAPRRGIERIFPDTTGTPSFDVLLDSDALEPVPMERGRTYVYELNPEDDVSIEATPGVDASREGGRVSLTPGELGVHRLTVRRSRRRIMREDGEYVLSEPTPEVLHIVLDVAPKADATTP